MELKFDDDKWITTNFTQSVQMCNTSPARDEKLQNRPTQRYPKAQERKLRLHKYLWMQAVVPWSGCQLYHILSPSRPTLIITTQALFTLHAYTVRALVGKLKLFIVNQDLKLVYIDYAHFGREISREAESHSELWIMA